MSARTAARFHSRAWSGSAGAVGAEDSLDRRGQLGLADPEGPPRTGAEGRGGTSGGVTTGAGGVTAGGDPAAAAPGRPRSGALRRGGCFRGRSIGRARRLASFTLGQRDTSRNPTPARAAPRADDGGPLT